jgi:hypothetical protein
LTQEEEEVREKKYFEGEMERIKKKYKMRDTDVYIPSEYGTYAKLTKQKSLFDYQVNAFVFKIQCLRKEKIIETRYIRISIATTC